MQPSTRQSRGRDLRPIRGKPTSSLHCLLPTAYMHLRVCVQHLIRERNPAANAARCRTEDGGVTETVAHARTHASVSTLRVVDKARVETSHMQNYWPSEWERSAQPSPPLTRTRLGCAHPPRPDGAGAAMPRGKCAADELVRLCFLIVMVIIVLALILTLSRGRDL